MTLRKAYKFRLKLSSTQAFQCIEFAGINRFIWNYFLRKSLHRLENKIPICWYQENDFWSKLMKASEEYSFLKDAPAHTLQQTLRGLDKAFKDGFDKKQPLKRIPTFKKKGEKDAFRFPEPKQIEVCGNRIKLPKLGWCRFFKSQDIQGDVRNVTVSRNGLHWFVSIQIEQQVELPEHQSRSVIGIDRGIKVFSATSGGQMMAPLNSFKKHESKLAKAQRALAKKKKFSENWKKQKAKVTKIHTKIANCRRDYLHQLSHKISESQAVVVLENLQTKNMSRSAKGDLDKPGKNVKAKSGLNKAILDQGWYEFQRQLEYKLAWKGGLLVLVPPHHTSQTCPVDSCRHVHSDNRKTQAEFECVSCGFEENADVVGAHNVLVRGQRMLACGEVGLPISMKQEPVGNREMVPFPKQLLAA